MSTISGTITGVTLVRAKGARKTYLITSNFAAYTGASDDAKLAAVGAAIATHTRNGKTNTLCTGTPAVPGGAGLDTNAQDVFFGGTLVKSTDDITGNLCTSAGAEITTSTACIGVETIVTVDET